MKAIVKKRFRDKTKNGLQREVGDIIECTEERFKELHERGYADISEISEEEVQAVVEAIVDEAIEQGKTTDEIIDEIIDETKPKKKRRK